jgi:hypothetical protein
MPKYLSSDNDPLYRFHQWASQSADTRGDRDQERPLRSLVPSVRGKANRHPSTRVFGSQVWTTADLENKLLDFRTYFNNHRTHNSLEGRTPDTRLSRPIVNLHSFRWRPQLSILIPDTSGCLICQRLALAVVSGQLLQKPRMKSSGVCVLSCSSFRRSDRSLPPY